MPPSPSLRVGPSGWEYPGWKGVVYPARQQGRAHPLEYLSRSFDVVEIESTFRRPLRPEVARLWLAKVARNPSFQFTAVLGRRFSYERSLDPVEVARFKEGLRPLLGAGRFGCLLLQFAWAFRFTPENREFLIQLRRAFHEFPMAVEMRHASWMAEEALGTLIDYRLGFANIDQPPQASAMPPSALVTSSTAYVRLHGRDRDYWRREFDVRARARRLPLLTGRTGPMEAADRARPGSRENDVRDPGQSGRGPLGGERSAARSPTGGGARRAHAQPRRGLIASRLT